MSTKPLVIVAVLLLCALEGPATATPSQQQGNKLVGTGAVGVPNEGMSVALSSDGSTAIVGGPRDSSDVGAAWVYARSGGLLSQQGDKLVGIGAVGNANQGSSVALSADGNTAIVGGSFDNFSKGAAWVYTRSGGVWSQQGNKLVGIGAVGNASQGNAVALSGDGNTAIVGGFTDNAATGAAWAYTRTGGVWSQQGGKLVGTGAVSNANEGFAVALSADGNTAIVGGVNDDAQVGASWVYTRSGAVWSQQGDKLVGTGAVGNASQGASVSLSGDGNTAIVGGPSDDGSAGATWEYTRSRGVWSQQGSKRVGAGAAGGAGQGGAVSLSADGNSAIVGGASDGGGAGAAWVFIDPATLSVDPSGIAPPAGVALAPVNPNPASGVVTLRFTLPHAASVSLAIFDPAGRRVRELASGMASEGEHAFKWDQRDETGRVTSAGVYLARLEVEGRVITRKLATLN
jgi:hypothetical protein